MRSVDTSDKRKNADIKINHHKLIKELQYVDDHYYISLEDLLILIEDCKDEVECIKKQGFGFCMCLKCYEKSAREELKKELKKDD